MASWIRIARREAHKTLDTLDAMGVVGRAERFKKFEELCPFEKWDTMMRDIYKGAFKRVEEQRKARATT